ncbi:nitrilase [Acrasis kona]|uniref:Nitrilase n=1 Tax=Acrasis kona TaxID=1008807 RepID=A0AAW2Z416_9EUKA
MAPKIALCQYSPSSKDLEKNFQAASELVRQAAKEGADLAVLPEYTLSLPIVDEVDRWADKDNFYLKRYQKLAKELNLNLVPGTIGEYNDDGTLTNNCYYIDRLGQVLHTYKKKNLWHPERGCFTKGLDEHAVFKTEEFGNVGLLICWDLNFPEAFRSLVAQGVQTIIAPTCWTLHDAGAGVKYNKFSEKTYLSSLITTRAFENEVVIVFVNAGGPESDGWIGMSQVTMPFYGKVVDFEGGEIGVKVCEIDYSVLDVAESVYKVRKDLSSQDWHY